MLSSLFAFRRARLVSLGLIAFVLPSALLAQLAPARLDSALRRDPCAPGKTAPGARFTIAPYAWLAGINGELGVRDLSADVDISFTDLLSKVRFAAMGTFEFGYDHWLGILDGVYSSVHQEETPSVGRLTADIDMHQRMLITNALLGYSFRVRPDLALDLFAGSRIWHVNTSLRLSGEDVGRQRQRIRTFADAIGGARVRWEPAQRWYLSLAGDGGAGASDGTAEGMGTAGYDVSRHWNVFVAYRYLYENYRRNDLSFKGHLSGPVLGAAYRW